MFIAVRNIVSIYRYIVSSLSACVEVEGNRVHVTGFTPETDENGGERNKEIRMEK